jgi:hypothetical protein
LLLVVETPNQFGDLYDDIFHGLFYGAEAATGRKGEAPRASSDRIAAASAAAPTLRRRSPVLSHAAVHASDATTEAMSRGTVTISNFGVFGVDSGTPILNPGTPILNPGETAILGVGAIRRQPWVVGEGTDERIEPRWVTTLALSFDHRVLDGQQGSELLADTAAFLRDPSLHVL